MMKGYHQHFVVGKHVITNNWFWVRYMFILSSVYVHVKFYMQYIVHLYSDQVDLKSCLSTWTGKETYLNCLITILTYGPYGLGASFCLIYLYILCSAILNWALICFENFTYIPCVCPWFVSFTAHVSSQNTPSIKKFQTTVLTVKDAKVPITKLKFQRTINWIALCSTSNKNMDQVALATFICQRNPSVILDSPQFL